MSKTISPPPTLILAPVSDPGGTAFLPSTSAVLDAQTVQRSYTALLSTYPQAPVAAVKREGLFVPMPASFPLEDHPTLRGRFALDLVDPADRWLVVVAWDAVLACGAARCVAHLAATPEVVVAVYFFDARPTHGVYLAVFAPAGGSDGELVPSRREPQTVIPRFATQRKDELGVLLEVDEATTQILGWGTDQLIGQRTLAFIHPDDQAMAIENWMDLIAVPGPGRRVRLRYRRRDGSWLWCEITNHNLLTDPDHRCVVTGMVDIAEEMAATEALRAREQLLDRLAQTVPIGLVQIDTARQVMYTNDRLHDIVGIGRMPTLRAQLSTVVDEYRPALEAALDVVLERGLDADIEIALELDPASDRRLCTLSLRPLTDEVGTTTGAILCVADVTEGARMRDELRQRATFDQLTGCYNRAASMLALEADLQRRPDRAQRAAIFIDLDDFKLVNDELGHAAGDELLVIAAQRLQLAVRGADLVGRIGGDEFLVICPQIGGAERAMQLAQRVSDALTQDIMLAAGPSTLSASVGVAWSQGSATSADTLVARADAAMYASKASDDGRPRLAVGESN